MRLFLLISTIFLSISTARAEDTLQQRYLSVYLKINEAENAEKKGDFEGALQDFHECYDSLTKIRAEDPSWESALVDHRLNDCQVKILDLNADVAAAANSGATNQLRPSQVYETKMAADAKQKVEDFIFAKDQRTRTSYPWKTGILTTLFWIGEDSSHASAWNEGWTKSNRGADDPDNRNGFASAAHASSVNPFYVALPFNDLAHPDKAKDWVPRSWYRANVDTKQVSACKDRWVCIKSAVGRTCYAQWEDVGPDGTDHAEYVFGTERPAEGKPGLDVSPAVAQYLGINSADKPATSWRFVDDQDVPPGQWLKYDEQAVIYTALHQQQKPDH